MDKLLNKLDTDVFTYYNVKHKSIVPLINFNISVLLNNIADVHSLYNSIRMHPALTEDIIVSIIKKMDRSQCYTGKAQLLAPHCITKCWLITQEFCEKYKADFCLTSSEMVSNCLPLKYIIDTHGNVLNKLDYYAISKYCTKSEYDEYCKDHCILSLENPNMTIDWYLECQNLVDINWHECATIRPDLFTPEVIMKYKDSIPVTSYIWTDYFKKLPVAFISANVQFKYMAVYDCIDAFKSHPGGISWHTIDKYISSRFCEFRRTVRMLTISDTVTDLPCWFVKKHIDILSIKCHNVNSHFNYKFISRHVANIDMIHINMIKIRSHYITMLKDIVSVCENNGIIPDLHDTILGYC
jgi:hypothetical protein